MLHGDSVLNPCCTEKSCLSSTIWSCSLSHYWLMCSLLTATDGKAPIATVEEEDDDVPGKHWAYLLRPFGLFPGYPLILDSLWGNKGNQFTIFLPLTVYFSPFQIWWRILMKHPKMRLTRGRFFFFLGGKVKFGHKLGCLWGGKSLSH